MSILNGIMTLTSLAQDSDSTGRTWAVEKRAAQTTDGEDIWAAEKRAPTKAELLKRA